MTALLGLIWSRHSGTILIVAAVIALGSFVYFKGRNDGKESAAEDARTAVFNQIKERSATDATVEKMSDTDLCRSIGGELRDGRCL